MYSGRIKKWTGYLPFKLWKERYYFIKGAMFCYSKVNDADQKRGSAFLGICEIEKINYLHNQKFGILKVIMKKKLKIFIT